MKKIRILSLLISVLLIISTFAGCGLGDTLEKNQEMSQDLTQNIEDGIFGDGGILDGFSSAVENNSSGNISINNNSVLRASDYNGTPYVAINNNTPSFTKNEITTKAFEKYSNLDKLGRCGVAYACLGKELMPTEERESLSSVTPSGWKNKKYDFVDGGWVYNRAHIIGFQLAGEQANEKNLITGTRYFNVDGMLTFENMVADYIKETGNHVMYRVTPIYDGDNLVCEGVVMEAYSVEDSGDGISFNVFCFNVQPDITIDYKTGDNWGTKTENKTEVNTDNNKKTTYILNTSSKKFHYETCSGVRSMSEKNKSIHTGTRKELIDKGYSACGICKP